MAKRKTDMEKSAPTVATFLYELICRQECFTIQINDQCREFVNTVVVNLHQTTGAAGNIRLSPAIEAKPNNKKFTCESS